MMKNTIATLCLVGSTIALSACNTTGSGNVETTTPYNQSRTATYGEASVDGTISATPTRVAPATQVFRRAQTK